MKFQLVVLTIVLTLISCNNHEEKVVPLEKDAVQLSMDKHADSLLIDAKINSVSIGIYKDGKKYTAHYGELDKGNANAPTDQTIYEIASVSKTLTGILVANAVLEGKLKLEEDIRSYLQEGFKNFEYKGEPIKVRHLLTHTSGMTKFLPASIDALFTDFNEDLPFKVYDIQKNYSKEDFFIDLHRIELNEAPGINYSYSNVDTEIMAQLLENVYDQSFNEILKNFFREHANMHTTQIDLPKEHKNDLANGYGMTGKLVPHEVVLYGADGGVKTTMLDLVNYMEFQLDETNPVVKESHQVLHESGKRQMAYYLPIRDNEAYGTYYSMHGGGFGSQNWFFILPEYDLGISVITNQSDLETADKLLKTVKCLIKDLL